MRKFIASLLLLTLPFLGMAQPILPTTGYTIGFMTNRTAASARSYLGITGTGGGGFASPLTAYVATNGNDGTAQITNIALPYATPHAAVNALNAVYNTGPNTTNLLVLIGPGIFDEGTNLVWPTNGMTVMGSGMNSTIIKSGVTTTLQSLPCFALNDGVDYENLFLWSTNLDGNFATVIGCNGNGTSNFTGTAYCNHVKAQGDTDIIAYFAVPNTNKLICRDWHAYGRWDTIAINSVTTNAAVELDGFTIDFVGLSAVTNQPYRAAVTTSHGTIILRNGTITIPTNANGQLGAFITGDYCSFLIDNVGFVNDLTGQTLGTSFADIRYGGGGISKKGKMVLGKVYHPDGTAPAISASAAGIASFGVFPIPSIDPMMLSEISPVDRTNVSLPTQGFNFGGTITVSNTANIGTGKITTANTGSIANTNGINTVTLVATNSVTASNVAAGSVLVSNNVSSIAGTPTAGLLGTPAIVATVALTSQSASIAATPLYTNSTGSGGLYRLAGSAQITTGGPSTGALTVNISWTNAIGAINANLIAPPGSPNAQTTAEYSLPDIFDEALNIGAQVYPWFFVANNCIVKYTTTYAGGTGNAMRYSLNLTLERLQ